MFTVEKFNSISFYSENVRTRLTQQYATLLKKVRGFPVPRRYQTPPGRE